MTRRVFAGLLCAAPLALFACNAVLGTGDYKVGHDDSDAGESGGSATTDMDGGVTPGNGGVTGTGGAGSGGKSTGTGGRAAGGATGGAPGTGGSTGSATDAFVGEWNTASEATIDDCSGSPMTTIGSDTLEFMAGAPGHITVNFMSCTLDATVSGQRATLPAQSCVDQGITYTLTGTFTIQANGTAILQENATIDVGSGVSCNVDVRGTFTKYMAP
jgi:hypothetical protein